MKRDNRREISCKRIQQNRRTILQKHPSTATADVTPTTALNPTADANMLALSIRMLTDELQSLSIDQLTAAYGVYDEEIDLSEQNPDDHHCELKWLSEHLVTYGRTTRTPLTPCL